MQTCTSAHIQTNRNYTYMHIPIHMNTDIYIPKHIHKHTFIHTYT